MGMLQPPPMRMVVQAKRPLQVLLINVPPFLHGARPMRSWLNAGGGGVRSIVMFPPPPLLKPGGKLETSTDQEREKIFALLSMSHADAALKVITAFRHFQQKLKEENENENYLSFAVHAIPANPDIPLPPAVMDKETVTVLGDKLYEAFQLLRDGKETDEHTGIVISSSTVDNAAKIGTEENINMRSSSDADGQDGDDGDDPLTTPTVLEAVRKFREQLSLQQGSKATRRQQLVKEAIAKALPIARQRLNEERAATAIPPVNPGLPLPGAIVGGGPPLPRPPPVAAEGPRGVSNMPAWMTQQQHQYPQDTGAEPPTKKVKLDLSDASIVFPAVTKADSVQLLRAFVTEKIRHYLGQEEADLIDFVHKHILEQKSVSALQSDLADVLDEDAPAFLQAMYDKTHELCEL